MYAIRSYYVIPVRFVIEVFQDRFHTIGQLVGNAGHESSCGGFDFPGKNQLLDITDRPDGPGPQGDENMLACPHAQRDEVFHEAAEAMPLPEASRDIIVSIFLFHELPPEVRGRVLAEVFRVLKPGGLFILADSVQFGDHDGIRNNFV